MEELFLLVRRIDAREEEKADQIQSCRANECRYDISLTSPIVEDADCCDDYAGILRKRNWR